MNGWMIDFRYLIYLIRSINYRNICGNYIIFYIYYIYDLVYLYFFFYYLEMNNNEMDVIIEIIYLYICCIYIKKFLILKLK